MPKVPVVSPLTFTSDSAQMKPTNKQATLDILNSESMKTKTDRIRKMSDQIFEYTRKITK